MRVLINNKESNYALQFYNVEIRKENIYIVHNYPESMNVPYYKINYNTFMELLIESFDMYIKQPDADYSLSKFETYFTYFKITTNPFIKKQMVTIIGSLFIKLFFSHSERNESIRVMIQNYKSYKKDIYYNYLLILLDLNNIEDISTDNNLDFDDEYFSFIDFILDYHLE
jgi:hypothetical protein|uniref:Uncharacterized protein n=1 Tax=viral metagenome TaxID=1070528 RepID=A0A6C0ISS8_9ZZZZ